MSPRELGLALEALADLNRRSCRPASVSRFSQVLALLLFFAFGIRMSNAAVGPLRPEKLKEMDAAIMEAVRDHGCPGGVLWVEHGNAIYHRAYGNRALVPTVENM